MLKLSFALVLMFVLTAGAHAAGLGVESVRVIPVDPSAPAAARPDSEPSDAAPPLMRPGRPDTYYDWYWQWRYIWMGILPLRNERYSTLRAAPDNALMGLDKLVLGQGDYSDTVRPSINSADIALVPEAPNDEIVSDGIFTSRFLLSTGDRVGNELNIKATLGRNVLRATVPRLGRDMVLVFDCLSVENEGVQQPLTVTVSAIGARTAAATSILTLHSSMLAVRRLEKLQKELAALELRVSRLKERGTEVSERERALKQIKVLNESAEQELEQRNLLGALSVISKAEARLAELSRQVR